MAGWLTFRTTLWFINNPETRLHLPNEISSQIWLNCDLKYLERITAANSIPVIWSPRVREFSAIFILYKWRPGVRTWSIQPQLKHFISILPQKHKYLPLDVFHPFKNLAISKANPHTSSICYAEPVRNKSAEIFFFFFKWVFFLLFLFFVPLLPPNKPLPTCHGLSHFHIQKARSP